MRPTVMNTAIVGGITRLTTTQDEAEHRLDRVQSGKLLRHPLHPAGGEYRPQLRGHHVGGPDDGRLGRARTEPGADEDPALPGEDLPMRGPTQQAA